MYISKKEVDNMCGVKETILWIVSIIIGYAAIWYLLYAIKNPVNLWLAALILVVLVLISKMTCPIIRRWMCSCAPKKKKRK